MYKVVPVWDMVAKKFDYTLIDPEDFEKVNQYYWYTDKAGYVRTHTANKLKYGLNSIYLARFILGITEKDAHVDHKNRWKLDNRKENLRLVPAIRGHNNRNKDIMVTNTSGYKGVHWCKRERKWQVRIWLGNYRKSLGYYFTIEEAAHRYNAAAVQYHGEFAVLNIIKTSQSNQGEIAMSAKKSVAVLRAFKDRDGKEHKPGEKIQVDSDYAQEIIKDGSVKEESSGSEDPSKNK